jgi:hypothetical protein
VIEHSDLGVVELNSGGCFAAEATADLACGQAQEDLLECEHFACDPPTSTDLASFQTCQTSADTGTCKCFTTAASSACSAFAGDACDLGSTTTYTTFDGAFKGMAAVMCGP